MTQLFEMYKAGIANAGKEEEKEGRSRGLPTVDHDGGPPSFTCLTAAVTEADRLTADRCEDIDEADDELHHTAVDRHHQVPPMV
jgi:hypothetical protein